MSKRGEKKAIKVGVLHPNRARSRCFHAARAASQVVSATAASSRAPSLESQTTDLFSFPAQCDGNGKRKRLAPQPSSLPRLDHGSLPQQSKKEVKINLPSRCVQGQLGIRTAFAIHLSLTTLIAGLVLLRLEIHTRFKVALLYFVEYFQLLVFCFFFLQQQTKFIVKPSNPGKK